MYNRIVELLPIGSIVSLKQAKKRVMISGYFQIAENDQEDKEYDYCGVPYPEGNIGTEFQVLFQHSDIDSVFFKGFEDIERQHFIDTVLAMPNENKE